MRISQHHFNVESDLIGSLLNHDSSIIPSSSKIDSFLDEFACELPLLKSIPPGIDETDYHPENEIQLLDNYSLPIPKNESFHFDIPLSSRPPAKPPDGNTGILNIKMMGDVSDQKNESFHFDIPLSSRPPAKPPDGNTGILNIKMMGDVSDQKVPIPEFTITRVSNQEKSPNLLSHRGFEIFQLSAECPMKIHGKNIPTLDVPHFHFYPP
uniref:Uncharacterized protein n=1 Tax=Tanacetum cinerariifolium TaxID=118510 RepID=A0A699HDX1_TANCI|nr:hypothetical protein [Tanacetum cinerariifolium]